MQTAGAPLSKRAQLRAWTLGAPVLGAQGALAQRAPLGAVAERIVALGFGMGQAYQSA